MSSLSMIEKRKLEDLLGMSSGRVLDFTDATFSDFFRTTVKINIDQDKYRKYGTSKAKRLRAFWEVETDPIVGAVTNEMIELWRHIQPTDRKESETTLVTECSKIVARLLGQHAKIEISENDFLKIEFEKVSFSALDLEQTLTPILQQRLEEAFQCRNIKASLSVIFMCGSLLEGLLLGVATKHPKEFNQARSAPKLNSKPKQFHDWKLGEFIDVAHELEFLPLDVKKFSHVLRDFRNYIHPYSQLAAKFKPDEQTADICLQVLKAAIAAIAKRRGSKL